MSTPQPGSSGADQTPGGASDKPSDNQNPKPEGDSKPQTVSHDTYSKVLDEAKKAKAKLAEFERKEKEREDAKLVETGEYKKLLDSRDAENKELKEKLGGLEGKIADGRKMNAFLGAVTGEVPKQYWNLIDLDGIAVDPATGMPDEASVKKAADNFEKLFPEVVKKPTKGRLPSDAPQGGGGKILYKDWLKLPYEEKIKRQVDVVD